MVDGCVFTGTDLGNVYALNADTGEVVWAQSLGDGGTGSGFAEGAGIVGSPAVADGLVYVGRDHARGRRAVGARPGHWSDRLAARGRRR